MAKTEKKFKCPLCGSTKYERVGLNTGPIRLGGGPNPGKFVSYKCAGCSIYFGDPISFMKVKKK